MSQDRRHPRRRHVLAVTAAQCPCSVWSCRPGLTRRGASFSVNPLTVSCMVATMRARGTRRSFTPAVPPPSSGRLSTRSASRTTKSVGLVTSVRKQEQRGHPKKIGSATWCNSSLAHLHGLPIERLAPRPRGPSMAIGADTGGVISSPPIEIALTQYAKNTAATESTTHKQSTSTGASTCGAGPSSTPPRLRMTGVIAACCSPPSCRRSLRSPPLRSCATRVAAEIKTRSRARTQVISLPGALQLEAIAVLRQSGHPRIPDHPNKDVRVS